MLRSLLGSKVTLSFGFGSPLGTIVADPSQLELMLLNLAANARDAIDRAAALAPDNGGLQAAHSKIIDLQNERARAISEGATPDSRRIQALDQQITSATGSLRRLVDANLRVSNERLIAAQQHEGETDEGSSAQKESVTCYVLPRAACHMPGAAYDVHVARST